YAEPSGQGFEMNRVNFSFPYRTGEGFLHILYFVAQHGSNGSEEGRDAVRFGDKSVGTHYGCEGSDRVVVHGEQHDLGGREVIFEDAGDFDSIQTWHQYVNNQQVGSKCNGRLCGFDSVASHGAHFYTRLLID